MKLTLVLVAALVLMVALTPAMAQERSAASLTESIAREAARLGAVAALPARNGSASAAQAASSRPAETLQKGTRIRVTTAPVAEGPGLMRTGHDVNLQAANCDAGERVRGRDGDSTAFRRPDTTEATPRRARGPVIGQVEDWDGKTLRVTCENGPVVSIPREAIGRLERSGGSPSRLHSAAVGLGIGAAVGGGIGLGVGLSSCTTLGSFTMCPKINFLPVAVLAGVGIGALMGASASTTERWTSVDVRYLDK